MSFGENQPLLDSSKLPLYETFDPDVIARFGASVRAIVMSNTDYAFRHRQLATKQKMMQPPSHSRIFAGYLVVRKLGRKDEYETWMPDHVFDDLYVLRVSSSSL